MTHQIWDWAGQLPHCVIEQDNWLSSVRIQSFFISNVLYVQGNVQCQTKWMIMGPFCFSIFDNNLNRVKRDSDPQEGNCS